MRARDNWGWLALSIGIFGAAGCGSDGSETGPAPGTQPPGGNGPKDEPANVVGGFSVQIEDQVLAAGAETFPCYVFPVVLDGPSHFVGGAKLTTGVGLHHGNLTARKKTGNGIRPCSQKDKDGSEAFDIAMGGTWVYASSTQVDGVEWQTFPAGYAYRIGDDYEIVARMHFLNATSSEITVAPKYDWYTVEESKVEHELRPTGWIYTGFEIPPQATHTVTAECEIPGPMRIVSLLPHMHKLGIGMGLEYMGGTRDRQIILDSKGYNPDGGVFTVYDPPVDMEGTTGSGVRFSCTWKNTFDKPIVEGTGDNEMCMLFAYVSPPEHTYFGIADPDSGCGVVLVPPPAK
jgi:hypothetical protein